MTDELKYRFILDGDHYKITLNRLKSCATTEEEKAELSKITTEEQLKEYCQSGNRLGEIARIAEYYGDDYYNGWYD